MKAVLLTGYGGLDKLVYTQVEKPIPQRGEVLIKVSACSVNNTDINTRTGWYAADESFQEVLQDIKKNDIQKSTGWSRSSIDFPRIQGADIVGQVVALGADVDPEILNRRVIVDPWIRNESLGKYQYVGSELNGGFAEYTTIPVTNVYPVSSSLSDVELATIPCSYSTAENLLTKGRVSANDFVLIMGASGGVGGAAIQLAKIRGATVIAIVGPDKEHLARELGADHIYPRNDELASNLARHQISVCLDVVGGEYFHIIIKALDIGGRYVTSGAIAGPMVSLDLRDLIYKDIEMAGATRFEMNIFQNLLKCIEQDLLKPSIAKIFPLSEIKEAQNFFQSKNFFGKVVITI